MTGEYNLILGAQWGDEGKGLHTARLAVLHDMVVRFNGGSNAGHTTIWEGQEVNTHQIPSGIFYDHVESIIGQGCLVNPIALQTEIADIHDRTGIHALPGRLLVDKYANLVLPHHILIDKLLELGEGRQGSTAQGIREVAAQKYHRDGVKGIDVLLNPDKIEDMIFDSFRNYNEMAVAHNATVTKRSQKAKRLTREDMRDLYMQWNANAALLVPYLAETSSLMNSSLKSGQSILGEGAQSIGLDIEEGQYPMVTSSHASPGGAIAGTGIDPHYINDVYGVAKLTPTRVGGDANKIPTIIEDEAIANAVCGKPEDPDGEYGGTTGRRRKPVWGDATQLLRAADIGVNKWILTKGDRVNRFGRRMKIVDHYMLGDQRVDMMPKSTDELALCDPQYREFDTWTDQISDVRHISVLPTAAHVVIDYIQEKTGVPVVAVGVGPNPEQFASV